MISRGSRLGCLFPGFFKADSIVTNAGSLVEVTDKASGVDPGSYCIPYQFRRWLLLVRGRGVGDGVLAGFGSAGFAGCVEVFVGAGVVVSLLGEVVFAVGVPEVEVPDAGVVVGLPAGRVVNGVGSGGSGFDITLAIISFRPVSD
jgi:hypothetical protein